MELAGTVPARDLLAGTCIHGGDGYASTVVNRQVNGVGAESGETLRYRYIEMVTNLLGISSILGGSGLGRGRIDSRLAARHRL